MRQGCTNSFLEAGVDSLTGGPATPASVAFLDADDSIVRRASAILPELALAPLLLGAVPLPSESAEAFAARAVREAHGDAGPSLMLAASLELQGVGGVGHWLTRDDVADVCRRHAGRHGLVRLALALMDHGHQVRTLGVVIPGSVADRPAAGSAPSWERFWVPSGYGRSLSEIAALGNTLTTVDKIFLDLRRRLVERNVDVFEAHLTVDCPTEETVAQFRSACAELGVKAIQIELPKGAVPSHLITGSFYSGALPEVRGRVEVLAAALRARGFTVARLKIEAMMSNAGIPRTDGEAAALPPTNYFELHAKVFLPEGADTGGLLGLCIAHDAHLSRNASNRARNGGLERFTTQRFYGVGRATAEAKFLRFVGALKDGGYEITSILKEYALLDTNLSLDAGWLTV